MEFLALTLTGSLYKPKLRQELSQHEKENALVKRCWDHIRKGKVYSAYHLQKRIKKSEESSKILVAVCEILGQTGKFSEELRISREIRNKGCRKNALRRAVFHCLKKGQVDRALRIISAEKQLITLKEGVEFCLKHEKPEAAEKFARSFHNISWYGYQNTKLLRGIFGLYIEQDKIVEAKGLCSLMWFSSYPKELSELLWNYWDSTGGAAKSEKVALLIPDQETRGKELRFVSRAYLEEGDVDNAIRVMENISNGFFQRYAFGCIFRYYLEKKDYSGARDLCASIRAQTYAVALEAASCWHLDICHEESVDESVRLALLVLGNLYTEEELKPVFQLYFDHIKESKKKIGAWTSGSFYRIFIHAARYYYNQGNEKKAHEIAKMIPERDELYGNHLFKD